jgi:hypothetical protein
MDTMKRINAAIRRLGVTAYYDRAGRYLYFIPDDTGPEVPSIYGTRLRDLTPAVVADWVERAKATACTHAH